MLRALPLVVACLLASPLVAQDLSDKRLKKAWAYLHPHEQRDVIEWWRLELERVDNLLLRLMRLVIERQEVDPGLWPLDAPPKWFDPDVHAPAQPIQREWASERRSERAAAKFLGERGDDDPLLDVRYDWGSGELRRRPDPLSPDEHFHNALHGYPPDLPLVRALVMHTLDRGEERAVLAAFSHAYTDRRGQAYPNVTLYDVWSSGETFEMPDVDVLGVIHSVLDDWRTWKAPVSSSQQPELYARVGELFTLGRRYRALREALAEAYLLAEPTPRDGYEEKAYAWFHVLWTRHTDPRRLRASLPDAHSWGGYLSDLKRMYDDEPLQRRAAKQRVSDLERSYKQVRRVFQAVLKEYGALERKRLPKLKD